MAGPQARREPGAVHGRGRARLLVAQAIGRVGNYFNQELFGGPASLPWGLEIAPQFRPPGYVQYATFQPTFLYELIFDLAWAALLVWLGHHRGIKPPGLFALYVLGYSAFRMFEESLRVDPSEHFLGLRLNMYVAAVLTLTGLAWFVYSQRRGRPASELSATGPGHLPAAGESAAAAEPVVPGDMAAGDPAARGDPEQAAADAAEPAGPGSSSNR